MNCGIDERATGSSTGDLDDIRDALILVDLASLQTYEQTEPHKVAEIVVSLRRTQILVNPIVVDPYLNLLIDGHHRVEAFRRLGLKRIPAYMVDYLSPAVDVRGWSRATTAPAPEVQWAFSGGNDLSDGSWSVMAIDSNRKVVAHRLFRGPASGTRYLEHLSQDIAAMGYPVTLDAMITPRFSGRIHSHIDPVVGKTEVLKAVEEGWSFPREVNRHLVDGRPIAMHVPLDSLTRLRDFEHCVDHIFQNGAPVFMSPGVRHDGRLYEERVTLFTPRNDGL